MGGVLLLTNNVNAIPLYLWLKERTVVSIYSDKIYVSQLEVLKPRLIISYNYNFIISKDIIDFMQGNIINMHISYLPYNRGFSPNIWSFIDDTPKGVTIHKLSEKLDEGDIIYQREMFFDTARETFVSTYDKLNEQIVELFIENWDEINNSTYTTKAQIGTGTKHSLADLIKLQNSIMFTWDDNIQHFLKLYKEYEDNNSYN